MKFIIKSLKENIYLNLLIIFFFLGLFLHNDYSNIKRYMDGHKYEQTVKISRTFFTLEPTHEASNLLYNSTYTLFEKKVKEYFSDYNVETRTSSITGKYVFDYTIIFTEETYNSELLKKIEKFNKLIIELHKIKMEEIFSLDPEGVWGNKIKFNIIDISNLTVHDLYIFKIHNQFLKEELKLGQKKKVLLSKLIIGNFLISFFLGILICLITAVIKDDIYQLKK